MAELADTLRPLPQNEFVTPQMMEAWGYPNDKATRDLIIKAHELEQAGHINCIAVAKNWVRGERPKPGGSLFLYERIDFNNPEVNPMAQPPLDPARVPNPELRATLNQALHRDSPGASTDEWWRYN